MPCVNKNDPNFKEILNRVGNPLLAEVEYIERFGLEVTPSETEEVKEGVERLFESNPELASIGTPSQYSAYLDSIFPESKVKGIVYHDTAFSKVFEEGFKKEFIGRSDGTVSGDGFYFYEEKSDKEIYESFLKEKEWLLSRPKDYPDHQDYTEKDWDKHYEEYREYNKRYNASAEFKVPAIINTKQPLDKLGEKYDTIRKNLKEKFPEKNLGFYNIVGSVLGMDPEKLNTDTYKKYQELRYKGETNIKSISDYLKERYGYDSVLGKLSKGKEFVVFEPNQVHILGTQNDIQGFKNYIAKETKREKTVEEIEETKCDIITILKTNNSDIAF